jgi:hypothetical protein
LAFSTAARVLARVRSTSRVISSLVFSMAMSDCDFQRRLIKKPKSKPAPNAIPSDE